jgi:hypothetical protein
MSTVTAHVTSLRQVDRIKATSVGRTFELSLTKGYVSRWGLAQAVRELIQNALDSDSPFVYEFRKTGESWTLVLNSEFATLTPQTLLLGHTSKANDPESIGSFGEGYKLALLVLTRMGYDVDMFNGDVLWRPRFRYSRVFGEELLVVDESFLADKTNKGLTVFVWGLSEQDKDAIVSSCIRMQDSIGAIKRTKYGDILLDRPKQLYVGDLYICETDLKHGYNIKPEHIQLERDRQTVDGWDLKMITARMWLDIEEPQRVAKMIMEEIPDVHHITYNTPQVVAEICYKLFREKHPEGLIAESPQEAAEKIKEGMIVYVGGGSYSAVSSSESYRSYVGSFRASPKVATPTEVLWSYLSAHQKKGMSEKAVTAFQELIIESKHWKSD